MNMQFLIGYVGGDPVIRYTPTQRKVATFTIATSRRWTDSSGNPQEATDWHNCEVWGSLADTVEKWLKKGRHVALVGRSQTKSYQGDDGNTRYWHSIVGRELTFLDRKPQEGSAPPVADDDIPF
jgi:single-strand DNA-binding protein